MDRLCETCRNYLVHLPETPEAPYAVGCRNKHCAEHGKPVAVPPFRYRPQELDPAKFLLRNAPLLVHDPTLQRLEAACERCEKETVHVLVRVQGKAHRICTACKNI